MREIGSLGHILAQQDVAVLVRAALPRTEVMSRDIADKFSQDIADTNLSASRVAVTKSSRLSPASPISDVAKPVDTDIPRHSLKTSLAR